jgi:DNA-binding PadR family transcriptional regulator
MAGDVRLTHQTMKVLKAMLENPSERLSGADVARTTGLMSGTLYPILARLEKAGWLESDWEEIDAREAGRPRRRLYKITGAGQRQAMAAFKDLGLSEGYLSWA